MHKESLQNSLWVIHVTIKENLQGLSFLHAATYFIIPTSLTEIFKIFSCIRELKQQQALLLPPPLKLRKLHKEENKSCYSCIRHF